MPSGRDGVAGAGAGATAATTAGTSTFEMTRPSRVRTRIFGLSIGPRSAVSTTSVSGMWMATRSRSWISIRTSKVGGALRSSTDFWVPRRRALELRADLVDDDDLGHVVLDCLDHHRVLQHRRAHLHATRAADSGMRNVAVTADLVRGVDDDDPLAQLVREQARAFAQHRGLADARPAQQKDALAADDD